MNKCISAQVQKYHKKMPDVSEITECHKTFADILHMLGQGEILN